LPRGNKSPEPASSPPATPPVVETIPHGPCAIQVHGPRRFVRATHRSANGCKYANLQGTTQREPRRNCIRTATAHPPTTQPPTIHPPACAIIPPTL
jgi:hypothetical protein